MASDSMDIFDLHAKIMSKYADLDLNSFFFDIRFDSSEQSRVE